MNRSMILLLAAGALSGCFPDTRTEDSATVTFDSGDSNSPPGKAEVAITPHSPGDADDLACVVVAEAVDPDGDVVTYAFHWTVDGQDAGLTTATASNTLTSANQEWTCTVTPSDGTVDGTSSSATVLIAAPNAAPSAPTISVSPALPTDADALRCDIDAASVDPNGDAVEYTYAWRVNGADAGITGATVAATYTDVNDTWACTVTASDGSLTTSATSASVVIVSSFQDYSLADGGTMVAIAAGSFVMGTSDYGPSHNITLSHDFWIGQTEVTQGQWHAVMGTDPSRYSCGDDCPVETVSWQDAARYANAVSTSEGLPSCYTASGSDLASSLAGDPYACEGYRLPTEAEWEYAANADDYYAYAGSNSANNVAWTADNSGGPPHEVATLTANAWGLYDMSGNVWEWVNDWYDANYYTTSPSTDPKGPSSGSNRGARGGSWVFGSGNSRIAQRSAGSPTATDAGLGFRILRTSSLP